MTSATDFWRRFWERLHDRRFWVVQVLVLAIATAHTTIEAKGALKDTQDLYLVPIYFIPVLYAALNFGFEGALPTGLWCLLLTLPNIVLVHHGRNGSGSLHNSYSWCCLAPWSRFASTRSGARSWQPKTPTGDWQRSRPRSRASSGWRCGRRRKSGFVSPANCTTKLCKSSLSRRQPWRISLEGRVSTHGSNLSTPRCNGASTASGASAGPCAHLYWTTLGWCPRWNGCSLTWPTAVGSAPRWRNMAIVCGWTPDRSWSSSESRRKRCTTSNTTPTRVGSWSVWPTTQAHST